MIFMTDILYILSEYAETLPPSPEAQNFIKAQYHYFDRLCELTSFDEADDIWNAAKSAGMAACSSDFAHGFQMGVLLWEQTHNLTH